MLTVYKHATAIVCLSPSFGSNKPGTYITKDRTYLC